MINNYAKYFTVLLLIFTNILFGQEKGIWTKINESTIASPELRKTAKEKYYLKKQDEKLILSSPVQTATFFK